MLKQNDLIDRLTPLLNIPNLPEEARARVQTTINEAKQNPLNFDVWIYRAVVVILGIAVVATVLGGIALTFAGHGDVKMALPEAIVAIGSAAVGALAGLLAPSPKGQ
jgi:hypothetical protein